ncbi:MAG: hypothetical protein JW761_11065 [Prolixibacteraceae bacterium]|nr:hypothetical protein [Prolixibacteraceae bacterium]
MLAILRFWAVFSVAFLLLLPFIKSLKKTVQNPVIITAWDNSASMVSIPDSTQVKNTIREMEEQISATLGNTYRIVSYGFGENTRLMSGPDFKDKNSNYSELISSITNNHFNENIGAVIIAGDGIYNRGKNPVNLLDEINFPVFTVGLGDTLEITDARIQNIRANRTAFSGNRFPVEVEIYFSKLKNTPLRLTLHDGETQVEETVITPPNDDYVLTQQFILDAGSPGLKHFSARIEYAENERNTDNNRDEFVINVLENKQKILILSDGPHPDIGAIKNTLDLQQTYEVSVFTEEPYPANLNEFNLIILNQLPTSAKSAATIIEKAEENRLPLLFIVGNKTFLPQLNALKQGAEIIPLAGSGEEVQATINPGYRIFTLSEEFSETVQRFPPLIAPFADYETDPEFSTLLYQKIKNIETAKPLIATGNINGRKTGFIFGEGIWRWRLYNYYFQQNQARFNELVNQLVQYLALRENEDNFILDFQPVYAETEEVIFRAEVYNEAYKKITSEEVKIKMNNQTGEEFDFTFDEQGENYFLNAGHLPTGDYSFNAEVTVGNETFTETGNFTVTVVNIENTQSRANHQVLYQLAGLSGGKFYLPEQTTRMLGDIQNGQELKPTVYFQEMVNELLNLRWLFVVVLVLLSVEWFLRKYWGIY